MLSKNWLVITRRVGTDLYYESRYYLEKPEDAALKSGLQDPDYVVAAVLPTDVAANLGYSVTIPRPAYDRLCEAIAASEWGWPRRYKTTTSAAPAKPRRAPDHAPNWWDMPLNPETGLRVDPEDAMAAVRAMSGDK